ncbi:MAG: GntR family transcriptional regulator [Candidatus Brocadiia bacterium]
MPNKERGTVRRRVANELRRRIADGEYAPGEQLPRRTELLEEFDVSNTTLQATFDRLVEEGFVRTAGKAGTFVEDSPPNLSRYAIVFPFSRDQLRQGQGWLSVLMSLLPDVEKAGSVKIVPYFEVTEPAGDEWNRLRSDCAAHRLAGVLFASSPQGLALQILFDHPDMPVATLTEPVRDQVPGITMDGDSYLARAVKLLQEADRDRVAVLTGTNDELRQKLRQQLDQTGMTTRDYWFVRINTSTPETAYDVAHLLMHEGQSIRPDGLIIADDTLVEPACAGLIAAGIRRPDQMSVVAHCNFPETPQVPIPVRFLGYDNVEMLKRAVDVLERQRKGEEVPLRTVVPPRSGKEIKARKREVRLRVERV